MFEDLDKETFEEILGAPEPRLDREDTPIVYLDQKIWGQLHAGRHNSDSRHADAYETIWQAVDDGDVICPYSTPASWKPTHTTTIRSGGSSTS